MKLVDYWYKHYCTDHCTICGNSGVIDSRGVKTPAGFEVGRLNYCICPNGVTMRKYNIDMEKTLARYRRIVPRYEIEPINSGEPTEM